MPRLAPVLASLTLLSALTITPSQAAAVDALTLTPNGTNTAFTLTGVYPAAPYTITFALPTAPTSLDFVDSVDGIFGINTTATLNGLAFPNTQIAFFTADQGGGLDVCLSDVCTPDPPTAFNRYAVLGDTLFTGTVANPVFVSGPAYVDTENSFVESPVPEPATLSLAGIGLVLAAVGRCGRKR